MPKKKMPMSVFDQIKTGLEDCLAHAKGERTLVTIRVPAPPPNAPPKRIAALRRNLHMSQSVFAATLNVSPKLVQSWEQGLRKPDRGALRLLQIIESHPAVVGDLFGRPVRTITRQRKAVA